MASESTAPVDLPQTETSFDVGQLRAKMAEAKALKQPPALKKPKASKIKPSGFEEFYADSPLTADEYREEKEDLYYQTRPFSERMQICIQRYRARRKLDEKRANIFTKYLILGGVEVAHKSFTGGALDQETLSTATKDEIAAIQAIDYIRPGNKKYYDPSETENWVVDFEAVAKGFFSCRVPDQIGIESEKDVNIYCSVIRNFLNYVLRHEVCPEYVEDVMAARKICGQAENELWAIKKLGLEMPGNFNIALSVIYGGRYQGLYTADQTWQKEDQQGNINMKDVVKVLETAILFFAANGISWSKSQEDTKIIKTNVKYYEIEDIKFKKNGVLGAMRCRPWSGPSQGLEDISDDEDETLNSAGTSSTTETLWLEPRLLDLMFVGMKLEMTVHELDNGFKFFDQAGAYCSFYTVLENEKMANYKEPVLSTRPGPTEDDPNAEERDQDDGFDLA